MNNDITLVYFSYKRKSSEDNKERQAASLPEQDYILKQVQSRYKLKVLDFLQESKSAHKPGREVFNTMLERIEKDEANSILTWHLNRLARNALDGGRIIYLMDIGKLVEIRTPSRAFHNTPEDKFMLNIEFGISKKDSDDKSIVVKRGLEKKLRDGWRPGVAPQGYLNDKYTESGYRKILIDPKRFPFICKIFILYHGGMPVIKIHRIAKDDWGYRTPRKKRSGGKPLSISMIYAILNNPFYYGEYNYPLGSENWYQGAHEPAVSKEMFEEIQMMLGRKSHYKSNRNRHTFAGLMRCGSCGSGIVADEKRQAICSSCKYKFAVGKKHKHNCPQCDKNIDNSFTFLHYMYYRCGRKKNLSCPEGSIRVDKLEKQVDNKLSKIEISPLFLNWAVRQIKKMNEQEKNFREETIKSIEQAHRDCIAKLDNLLQLKISPENKDGSLLSDYEYKRQKQALEGELKLLEERLSTTDSRMLQAADDAVRAFTFAARAKERFANGDKKTKRDIFRALGLNMTLKDRKVLFNSPEYMIILKNMKSEAPIIAKRVELNEELVIEAQTDELFSSIPTVLRGQELNLV